MESQAQTPTPAARWHSLLLGRKSEHVGLLAVGVILAILVAIQPTRLFPFTSTAMWFYLPIVLLVTFRWGARYGVLTAFAASLVVPSFFVNRAADLLTGGASANVLHAAASVGMLVAVLGVADLNRRRLATEQERRRETESLLSAAEQYASERAVLIQDLRQSQEQLAKQAYTDALTGLPNRLFFAKHLKLAIGAMRRINRPFAVLYVDLDGFKLVNDSLGHAAGDALLVAVGQRLTAAMRSEGDLVARLGGDEFAMLLEYMTHPADARSAAERIGMALARPVRVGNRRLSTSASIGITMHTDPASHDEPQELLREADIAMYAAKAAGKAQAVLFSPEMGTSAVERLDLESDLHHALDRGELALHYQPILDLRTGALEGMEALLRWHHPKRGLLRPSSFIPLAEEAGLIMPIGRWVLEEACKQAQAWCLLRPQGVGPRVSVNLSARQLERPEIIAEIALILHRTGLDPACLELELTESMLMQNARSSGSRLAGLKQLGLSLAIDDFGTGYSSLAYLEQLDVDRVKIDRSFVRGLKSGGSSPAIIQAIVAMTSALGMEAIAEGIENPEQLAFLRDIGCTLGQGYHFSRPVTAAAATRMVESRPQPALRVVTEAAVGA